MSGALHRLALPSNIKQHHGGAKKEDLWRGNYVKKPSLSKNLYTAHTIAEVAQIQRWRKKEKFITSRKTDAARRKADPLFQATRPSEAFAGAKQRSLAKFELVLAMPLPITKTKILKEIQYHQSTVYQICMWVLLFKASIIWLANCFLLHACSCPSKAKLAIFKVILRNVSRFWLNVKKFILQGQTDACTDNIFK